MTKPTASEEELVLATQALRLMDEQHLELTKACDQVVFGHNGTPEYTEASGKLLYPVRRCLRELLRKRRSLPRQATLSFSDTVRRR